MTDRSYLPDGNMDERYQGISRMGPDFGTSAERFRNLDYLLSDLNVRKGGKTDDRETPSIQV
jgi:hypothetical protein